MRVPGAVYIGREDRKYLATYNFHHDLYFRLPKEFQDLEYIAHISYTRGDKHGGIGIYRLTNPPPDISKIVDIKKEFTIKARSSDFRLIKDAKERYDIKTQIASNDKKILDEIHVLSGIDITMFCGKNVAKIRRGPRTEIVDKIIPRTRLKRIEPKRVLNNFVKNGYSHSLYADPLQDIAEMLDEQDELATKLYEEGENEETIRERCLELMDLYY